MKLIKLIHWLLLIFIIIYIISGLGIIYSQIVEPLTFGLLTKVLSFQIHIYLLIPFIIILIAHIISVLGGKKNHKK